MFSLTIFFSFLGKLFFVGNSHLYSKSESSLIISCLPSGVKRKANPPNFFFLPCIYFRSGLDGIPGRNGVDGIPGQEGIPGRDGRHGTHGRNGTDGSLLEICCPAKPHRSPYS